MPATQCPVPTCDAALQQFFQLIADILNLILLSLWVYVDCIKSLFIGRKEKSVRGKVIVITGAGHGLGKEMASLLADRGANLALVDINEENVADVADGLKGSGVRVESFVCDVRSQSAVADTFAKIKETVGQVDFLINNAGIVSCKPFAELTTSNIERTFQVNVFAHFWTIRAVLPDMIKRGHGHIAAISSIAGVLGTANLTDYCASKFAIVGLMKSLEQELHEKGDNEDIRLTTILPLAMTTGMFHAPRTRFESVFPVVDPTTVAKKAVHAILTNQTQVFVPKAAEYFYRLGHIFPTRIADALQSFFQYGVDPHKDD